MKFQFILVIAALLVCGVFAVREEQIPLEKKEGSEWSYADQSNWPGICSTGKFQSPININTYKARRRNLFKLPWQPQKESQAHVFKVDGSTTAKFDSPHTDALEFDDPFLDKHNLIEVHYHVPSEHRIDGKQYPLELHFIHENHYGGLAVIGVFFKEGKRNKNLYQLINKYGFPEQAESTNRSFSLGSIIKRVDLDNYWTYSGSLTTPPCIEGVTWFILKKALTASEKQIKALQEAYGNSARKTQVLHTRTVWAREQEHDHYNNHHDDHYDGHKNVHHHGHENHDDDKKHRPQHDNDYDREDKPRPKPQHDNNNGYGKDDKPRPKPQHDNDYGKDDKPRPKPKPQHDNDYDRDDKPRPKPQHNKDGDYGKDDKPRPKPKPQHDDDYDRDDKPRPKPKPQHDKDNGYGKDDKPRPKPKHDDEDEDKKRSVKVLGKN